MTYYPMNNIFINLTEFQDNINHTMEEKDSIVMRSMKLGKKRQIEYLEKLRAIPDKKHKKMEIAIKILEEMEKE